MYCGNEVEGLNCFGPFPPRDGLDSKDADHHDSKGSDEYRDHRYHDKCMVPQEGRAGCSDQST